MKTPNLLTFPARPVNGGHLKHAMPKKPGLWSCEPKYNGWRAIVHVPTGAMWNRHGQRLTIEAEFECALQRLARSGLEWADVEALERRHDLGRGCLIVLDWPTTKPIPYDHRREELFDQLIAPGLAKFINPAMKPEPNCLYIPVRCDGGPGLAPVGEVESLWQQLQDANKRLGCDFYEGVVAKRNNSLYPIQLNNPDQTTGTWMKHRFLQ